MAQDNQHDHDHDHVHDHVHGGTPVRGPVDGTFVPRPAPGLHTMDVDGELLLLDPRTDRLHLLDPVATVIWSVLDGEVTVDELVGDLADAFDTPPATVRADLDGLVRALDAAALLEGVEPPAHLLVGAEGRADDEGVGSDGAEGLWRPDYLRNPPAP